MLIDYPHGPHVIIWASMANATNRPTTWFGHEATIEGTVVSPQPLYTDGFRDRCIAAGLEGEWKERGERRGRREVIIDELHLPESERSQSRHLVNWLDCIRSRQTPNLDAYTGFQIMTAIAMAVESYRKGRTMYFDERNMVITDTPIGIGWREL